MSVLFLTFKPAEKQHDGEHRKPYDQSYVWIGTPIEVLLARKQNLSTVSWFCVYTEEPR